MARLAKSDLGDSDFAVAIDRARHRKKGDADMLAAMIRDGHPREANDRELLALFIEGKLSRPRGRPQKKFLGPFGYSLDPRDAISEDLKFDRQYRPRKNR